MSSRSVSTSSDSVIRRFEPAIDCMPIGENEVAGEGKKSGFISANLA